MKYFFSNSVLFFQQDAQSCTVSSPSYFLPGPSQNAAEEPPLLESDVTIKTEEGEMEEFDSKQGILPDHDTSCDPTYHADTLIDEDGVNASDDSGILVAATKPHKRCLTKNVPASFAYWFRGVRCPICYNCFRGRKCVINVLKHLRRYHKDEVSQTLLEEVLENTTPEKVIGAGMRYCDCQSCSEAYRLEGYTG